nr:hypothetical protein [Mycoplasmopsis bovis]
MKLYLDTANDDFVLAAFDDNYKLVYSKILKKYQKKVELIPLSVSEMLNSLSLTIDDFNEFYTNLGPRILHWSKNIISLLKNNSHN